MSVEALWLIPIPGMEFQETLDKGIALEDTLNFFKKENLRKISGKSH